MGEMDGYWDALARPWLAHEGAMERLLAPVGAALDEALGLRPGEAVLDIGPGSGASLLRFAEAVGPEGRVVGVDIAPPFAARARARTGREVILADAGAGPVAEGAFDVLASQFGVMFFDDPGAAFREIGRNLRPGGRFAFVAWGPRAQNPLFSLPGRVATDLFGPLPPVDPDAPGPFGLQNASRTVALLSGAGFAEVSATTVGLDLDSGLDAAGFAALQAEVGPAAGRLREAGGGAEVAGDLKRRLAEACLPYAATGSVVLPGVVHVYRGVWPG